MILDIGLAVGIAGAAFAIMITAVVCVASLLTPGGAHHTGSRRQPRTTLVGGRPKYTIRVIADVREPKLRPFPGEQILPRPGLLELPPVPPPADTGELPALTNELGEDFEDWWQDRLVTTGPQGAAP